MISVMVITVLISSEFVVNGVWVLRVGTVVVVEVGTVGEPVNLSVGISATNEVS